MRMMYKTYPTDYVQELKSNKKRKKARAFMEYWDDMEFGDHNSYGFYAKSWEVSKSTAHAWIDEFMHEIELFLSHWEIRNKQHYKHAKKSTERKPNETNANKAQNIGVSKDSLERQPNEAFNLNNNKKDFWWQDKDFNDLFFIYGANTKYKGKKEEAFEVFKHVDVDINILKIAAMRYLHDPDTEGKRYNLTNFLKNEMYVSYMPNYIRVETDTGVFEGTYDNKTYEFKSVDGKSFGKIEPKLLLELFESGKLRYLKEIKRG